MMARRACAWLGLALVCASLGGCGETEAEAIPREQLPAKVAEVFCQSLGSCCSSAGFAFDAARCQSSISATYAALLDDTSSPNVIYDGQAAGDCLSTLGPSLQCGRSSPSGSSGASCGPVFQGTLKPGQACQDSRECERPAGGIVQCTIQLNATDTAKVCIVENVGAAGTAGEACVGSCDADICGFGSPGGGNASEPTAVCYRRDGLYCAPSGKCESLQKRGSPCGDSGECERGSFCDDATALCTAPRAANELCSSDQECLSGNCDDDSLHCTMYGVTADNCAMPKLF